MGKGAGTKVQVTEYYMSQHFGVCIAVDALKKIIIKEKVAWSGYLTARTKLLIQKDDLFGGATKEGGATGTIYFLPGRSDQLLYDELATRLGRANGADAPGYRGITSVFFTGRPDANKGVKGFYWTANSPYLPGVWTEVERAPVGLDAAYAMIPRPGSNFFPWETLAKPGVLSGKQYYARLGWLYLIAGTQFQAVDLATRTVIESTIDAAGGSVPYAFTPTGIISMGSDMVSITYDGDSTLLGVSGVTGWEGCSYAGGDVLLYPGAVIGNYVGVFDGSTIAPVSVNHMPTHYFTNAEGASVAVGTTTGNILSIASPATEPLAELINTSAYGSSGAAYGFDNGLGQYVVRQGTHLFLVDKATLAIVGHNSDSGPGGLFASFDSIPEGASTFWNGLTEYSSVDLSARRSVTLSDWAVTLPGGTFEAVGSLYDPVNNGLINVYSGSTQGLIFRFLDRGERDANPAHIIYECLTNTDWGMGSPSSLIDVDVFEDVAVTLFDEPLGLSMIWTRQASIENFIQEVLDHIQGAIFVDPRTGLLTLKLIRGDYDPDTLPSIDPSTATLTNFGRKLWGEIVNEITVTWTNPDNEQDETITAQDLASIVTQGGIVSDSRNYYGVRYAALAQALAARDLRSAGAPLATCEAEVDRSLWALRPASVLKVDWPEYGLDGVVMRVTSIDYGKPGDPTIKLTLIEDVFGLDAGDYVAPPTSAWEDPSTPPEAMGEQSALTLPYYFAVNGLAPFSGATFPEVYGGALGASANADVSGFELWGEVALSGGGTEWQSLATLNIVGHGELTADLAAEAESSSIAFGSFVGTILPVEGGFAIIGAGTEEENELALITAAASDYTLSRGILDTIPRAWPAGTAVWFIEQDTLLEDPTVRSAGEVVSYRLRTRTSQGLLPLYSAPIVSATLTERPWLPSRPANVKAYGAAFTSPTAPINAVARPNPWVTVTWANRDRLTEDSSVLAWTDATVTAETGQTTQITVHKLDGTVLATHSGLSGTSYDVPDADFGSEEVVIIRTASMRTDADGTFDSLQHFEHWVIVSAGAGVEAASGAGAFSGAGAAIKVAALSGSGSAGFSGSSSGIVGSSLSGAGAGALSVTGTALAGSSLSGAGSGALSAVGSTGAAAAPTLFATNTNLSDNVSSLNVTWPGSLAADDIGHLFVHITHPSALPTITDPSGWTLIESILSPDGLTATKHYWKRLTGSESGTFTVSLSGGTSTGVMQADLSVWRGCKTSGNPYEQAIHRCETSRTVHYAHDVTTQGPYRRVMSVFGVSRTNTTGSAAGSWTEDWEQNTANGLGANGAGYSIEQVAAGYVGPCAVTVGTTSISTSITLAWIPVGDTASDVAFAVTVRGSRITWVNNASSLVFSLPPSSAAGDQCIIFTGHGWGTTTPSGWNSISNLTGSNANGAAFEKVLSAADITAGTVTISFAGSYYGVVGGISLVGPTGGVRTSTTQRDSTGAATRNISTSSAPVAADYAAYFGFGRFNGTVTADLGSALQTTSNNEGSAVLKGNSLGSGGVVSPTFSFSASPTGDYVAVVVLAV